MLGIERTGRRRRRVQPPRQPRLPVGRRPLSLLRLRRLRPTRWCLVTLLCPGRGRRRLPVGPAGPLTLAVGRRSALGPREAALALATCHGRHDSARDVREVTATRTRRGNTSTARSELIDHELLIISIGTCVADKYFVPPCAPTMCRLHRSCTRGWQPSRLRRGSRRPSFGIKWARILTFYMTWA